MKLYACSVLALCCLALAPHSGAQELPATDAVATELRQLTRTVEKIASQLEKQQLERQEEVRFRKLDLAIAYLNFRSRRIESIERDIETQRTIRSRMEENLPMLADRIRDLEARMQEYPQGPPEELQEAHRDFLNQTDILRDRIARIDDHLVMRENLLYELQGQIRDIETFVQRNLEM